MKKEKGKKERQQERNRFFLPLFRGMVVAFAVTCIIFIGFGILLTYTDVSEESLPLVSLLCTAVSAAIAGYDWAACTGRKGILWGMAAGLVYTGFIFGHKSGNGSFSAGTFRCDDIGRCYSGRSNRWCPRG